MVLWVKLHSFYTVMSILFMPNEEQVKQKTHYDKPACI